MKPSEPLRGVLRPVKARLEIETPNAMTLTIHVWKENVWRETTTIRHPSIDAATRNAQDLVWHKDQNADYMIWFYDQDLQQWQAEYNAELRFVMRRAAG